MPQVISDNCIIRTQHAIEAGDNPDGDSSICCIGDSCVDNILLGLPGPGYLNGQYDDPSGISFDGAHSAGGTQMPMNIVSGNLIADYFHAMNFSYNGGAGNGYAGICDTVPAGNIGLSDGSLSLPPTGDANPSVALALTRDELGKNQDSSPFFDGAGKLRRNLPTSNSKQER